MFINLLKIKTTIDFSSNDPNKITIFFVFQFSKLNDLLSNLRRDPFNEWGEKKAFEQINRSIFQIRKNRPKSKLSDSNKKMIPFIVFLKDNCQLYSKIKLKRTFK